METIKMTKIDIDKYTRVSVVEWNPGDFSVRTEFNPFPFLNNKWENYEVYDEQDLSSSQEVYGYLENVRKNSYTH